MNKWEEAQKLAKTVPLLYTKKAKEDVIGKLLEALKQALKG